MKPCQRVDAPQAQAQAHAHAQAQAQAQAQVELTGANASVHILTLEPWKKDELLLIFF